MPLVRRTSLPGCCRRRRRRACAGRPRVCRFRRVAFAARRARAVPLAQRDVPPQPRPAERRRRLHAHREARARALPHRRRAAPCRPPPPCRSMSPAVPPRVRPVLRLSRCPEFRGGGARGSLRVAAEGGTARTCIIIGKRVPWKEGSARLKCPTKLECPPSCPAEQRSAEPRGEKP